MSNNKSAPKTSSKKPLETVSKRKIIALFSKENLNAANLDLEILAKLQTTMYEAAKRLIPEYKEWLISVIGEKSIDENIDQIAVEAVNKAMNEAVRKALEENEQPPIMENWFEKKFYDDVSDIRPKNRVYYKHYVHNFVTHFFSKEYVAGKKILDFGCGPGFYSAILAQRGAQVIGIDKSKFLISKAQELKEKLGLSNVEFFHRDFLEFAENLRPKEFDYVVAIDTIVSFDFSRKEHNHEEFSQALSKINRILKDQGRFFIIEAHPFFGQLAKGIALSNGGHFRGCLPRYKIEHKHKDNPNHWFTLSEMTNALSENQMAILHIYEPDPSVELKKENAQLYKFLLKYPHLIVYEIGKVGRKAPSG